MDTVSHVENFNFFTVCTCGTAIARMIISSGAAATNTTPHNTTNEHKTNTQQPHNSDVLVVCGFWRGETTVVVVDGALLGPTMSQPSAAIYTYIHTYA